MSRSDLNKCRYVMVGGFLGAGKTTAIARLAARMRDAGLRVGLITNDQGSNLVDTAMLRGKGFETAEISGGCFCCRFNSLMDAARQLTVLTRPDVFIAEPVGSCTDLVATVTYPLRRIYGQDYSVAPLSVLIDPVRALRVFGLEPGPNFSEKVIYVYRKQLEEADIIVINKRELITPEQLRSLKAKLASEFPRARCFAISARLDEGLDEWFELISSQEQIGGEAMEIDYDIYAEGEALLGWLNATFQFTSPNPVDANHFLRRLADEIRTRLQTAGAEIAHLKMTFSPDSGFAQLAVINLVRNDYVSELSQELEENVESGQIILNLRAEGGPEKLREIVTATASQCVGALPGAALVLEHIEAFRPGRPTPTHRLPALV